MKNLLICISAIFALAACSSSSSTPAAKGSDNPNVIAFEKATAGEWISECYIANGLAKIEKIVIGTGGTFTSTVTNYQTQDCSGNAVSSEGPNTFGYSADAPANGVTVITLNTAQGPVKLNVVIDGNQMTIESEQTGRINFNRVGGGPANPNNPVNAEFDRMAIGTWINRCFQEGQAFFAEVLTVQGQGRGTVDFYQYFGQRCEGQARHVKQDVLNYVVDQFANNQGQLTINGTTARFQFMGNQMVIASGRGTFTYEKQ